MPNKAKMVNNQIWSPSFLRRFLELQKKIDRWFKEDTTFRLYLFRRSFSYESIDTIDQTQDTLAQKVGTIPDIVVKRIKKMRRTSKAFSQSSQNSDPYMISFARATEKLLNSLVDIYGPYPEGTFPKSNRFFQWEYVEEHYKRR